MTSYYTRKLTAQRLKQVYDIADPRVRQYLKAESDFVLDRIRSGDRVLDLGCGYGRIMSRWAKKAGGVVSWELPHYLIQAIASHHVDLNTSESEPAIKIVSLIKNNNDSNGTEKLIYICETQFGFSKHHISEIIQRTFDDAKEFSQMLQ